ncbi:MAG: hypothetical protein HRT66_13950 [Flavobacteriaceae bacterium]|nr:hypothetical protein [Flavobacteriaceae bacterium]
MRKEFRLLFVSFVLLFAFASCDDKDDEGSEKTITRIKSIEVVSSIATLNYIFNYNSDNYLESMDLSGSKAYEVYKYNVNKQLVSRTYEGGKRETKYEYNTKGEIVKSTDYENNIIYNTMTYSYDDKGMLFQHTYSSGSISEYSYEDNKITIKEKNNEDYTVYEYDKDKKYLENMLFPKAYINLGISEKIDSRVVGRKHLFTKTSAYYDSEKTINIYHSSDLTEIKYNDEGYLTSYIKTLLSFEKIPITHKITYE